MVIWLESISKYTNLSGVQNRDECMTKRRTCLKWGAFPGLRKFRGMVVKRTQASEVLWEELFPPRAFKYNRNPSQKGWVNWKRLISSLPSHRPSRH